VKKKKATKVLARQRKKQRKKAGLFARQFFSIEGKGDFGQFFLSSQGRKAETKKATKKGAHSIE